MFIGDGDSLGNMLINQEADCLECGNSIVFKRESTLAKENGISDNVVMCSQCMSVWKVYLVPRRMALTENVTSQYFTEKQRAEMQAKQAKENRNCLIWIAIVIIAVIALLLYLF